MPPVIVAVVAAAATYAATAGAAVVLGIAATSFTAIAIGAVAGAVVAYAGNALIASTVKAAKPTTQQASQDAKQLIRSSVEPRRVVYGRARVSGPIVFAESSGINNERLSMVVPVAGHHCDGYEGVWINDTWIARSDVDVGSGQVVSGPMAGKVYLWPHFGDQTGADGALLANGGGWATSDIMRDITYFHVMYIYDENMFRGGVPNFSALMIGKNDIYDPRYGTRTHSENWALIILDYLRSHMGLACGDDEIDFDSFVTAANIAGEVVQVNEEGTEFQERYTLNGTFQLDRTPIEVMEEMIAAGGGALVYVQGKYRLYAGAYDAPITTIDESHLAGEVQVQVAPARRDHFNSVRGTFIDNRRNYTAAEFQGVSDARSVAADGEKIWRDIDLPWCRDSVQAQRIAVLMLRRHLQSLTVTMPLRYASLNLCVMDTVAVTLADFGWNAKPFRIIAYTFDPATGIINATMQEEQPAAYAWLPSEASSLPRYPDTNLVSPFTIPAPPGFTISEALYATRDGAGVRTKAILKWAAVRNPFIRSFEVQYRTNAVSTWSNSVAAPADATQAEILDLANDDYQFRVRARATFSSGEWATQQKYIGGLAAVPPANIAGLSGQVSGGMLWMRWNLHPDIDVRAGGRIEFRHHPDAGSIWANATSIGEAAPGNTNFAVLPLRTGTYFAKAVDAGGRYSADAATYYTVQEGQLGYANLVTMVYDTAFLGTKVRATVVDDTLRLTALGLIDDEADFDAIELLDGLGGIAPTGYALLTGWVNLGSPQRVRVTPTLRATVVNTYDQFDSRSAPIDDWTSVDGVVGGEADAWIEVSTTTDDPTATPTYTPWQRLDAGEFYMWNMRVRAQLRSSDPAFNIHIDQIRVSADKVV